MVDWHVMHKRHPTHLVSGHLGSRESPFLLLVLGDGIFHSFDMARNLYSHTKLHLGFFLDYFLLSKTV